MRGSWKTAGRKSRHARTIHVAPITRAVRSALAASAIALAGVGAAQAGDCPAGDRVQLVRCAQDIEALAPVVDLTAVGGQGAPSAVIAGQAAGISPQAASFTVTINNNGPIAKSGSGDVIGIDADFAGADVTINNKAAGTIDVESVDGLADGIFAYGDSVKVTNAGGIDASGSTWGAGIEAQGDTVTVTNTGSISASASAYDTEAGVYGHAYGIYAAGGDGGVSVTNRGSIEATGPYATGIFAYDSGTGGVDVKNRGDITATAANGYAWGVNAQTNVEGSDISVLNAAGASITADGMNGATGISATATGTGSDASVDNRGDISASSQVYYSVAAGISVSADGDATINNSGSITIGYGDYAYGGLAMAFAGDADVDNSGDVVVNGGFGATGFVVASQNGYADAHNSGSITVDSLYGNGIGIDAGGQAGTDVTNDGTINASGKYAFGVLANSGAGDTQVTNNGDITTSASKYSFGVLAQAGDGDATIDNAGTVASDGKYSFALRAGSTYGDATINNTGSATGTGKYAYGAVAASNFGDATINNAEGGTISGISEELLAVGAFANANYDGSATIDNAGSILASGSGYAQIAYGAVVQTDAGAGLVSNSGDITAENSYGGARAVIVRSSDGGDASVDNSGSISAFSTGSGVYEGYYGTYTVNTDVVGVYAYAPGGAASVSNSGSITASTAAGMASGVFAAGATADVDNSGDIAADGYTWAAGIEAQGDDSAYVNNSGIVSASATAYAPADEEAGTEAVYGHAYGIYATGGDGGVLVYNTGSVSASGPYATGIFGYDNGTGGVAIGNFGDVTATADNGFATGIAASTNVEGSDIEIGNAEGASVSATGMNGASGIVATATGTGSSATVDNRGDIYAASTVYYSVAEGIAISADGDATLRNSGSITIGYGDYAYGGLALAFAGDAVVDNEGTVDVTGGFGAYGFVAASQNGTATVSNSGSITVDSGFGTGAGIDANGYAGTLVQNSGDISATANKYAFGVHVNSGQGDAQVNNSGTISTDGKYSFGVLAQAGDGDAIINNSGAINATGKYAYGAEAASTYGNSIIYNSGIIAGDSSDLVAVGAFANANGDSYGAIVNNGLISATGSGYAQIAYGAVVQSDAGSAFVSNGDAGQIDASNGYGAATGVIVRSSAGGDVAVDNSGYISATTTGTGVYEGYYGTYTVNTDAIGVYAYAPGATAEVSNSGSIAATSSAGLADGVFASGAYAYVDNSGSITADGYTWGAGIEAQGDDGAWIRNTGDVSATATAYAQADEEAGTEAVYGHAYGIYATGGDAGVYVGNRGTVAATGPYATGIHGYDNGTGGVGIANRGDVSATAVNGVATGINAVTNVGGSDIEVLNRGGVDAYGYNSSAGIAATATGEGSSITVTNSGSIASATVPGSKYGNASGIVASGDGDVNITNGQAGTIDVSGGKYAYGVLSLAFAGDSHVVNAGDITVSDGGGIYGFSYGVVSSSQNGLASVSNRGNISVVSDGLIGVARAIDATGIDATVVNRGSAEAYGKYSRGISAVASQGDVTVQNPGSVYAGGKYSYGIAGISTDGDVRLSNGATGTVDAFSYGGVAVGVLGTSTYDNVNVTNQGSITARGDDAGLVVGIYASSDNNDVTVANNGVIDANTAYGNAFGVLANIGSNDELAVTGRGSISATSVYANATGIDGSAEGGGDVALRNAGAIEATSTAGDAIGVAGTVAGGGLLKLVNGPTGSITATTVDGDAVGLQGTLTESDVSIVNNGSISVDSTNGTAYAIRVQAGDEGLAAGDATITNSGTLQGAVATAGGNDRFTNARGGTWTLSGSGTDFGAGNDTFTNAAGATVELSKANIAFGAGSNRFSNAGTLKVSGENFIDMTDGSASAAAAALKPPKGTASFTNSGVIDFLDGAADDSLTITGGFAGSGSVNMDVSLLAGTNDTLFVNGATASGTKQLVNVMLLDGLPRSGDVGKQLQLIHVSGGTSPSAFGAGQVLGVSPRDFLAMGMTLDSKADATAKAGSGGSSYLLSVKTYVSGLNAAGVLASSAALGVDSLMSSSAGSWRDRQYALTAAGGKPAFATITPWVRGFNDEGGMSPDHLSANFGQLANSRVSQDNAGTEMGLEFQGTNGLRVGTVFAKSEGKQYLVDEHGLDTLRGSTMGLYATWVGRSGLYVDASWRTMKFDANIDSVGGRQRTEGDAYMTSIETGYTWSLANGLNIEPKLQYTSTSIDGLRIQGDDATFRSEEARWDRGEAGVSLYKTFGGGSGWRVTPYGEVSMLRTFNGIANYAINEDYFGNVMTEGTSVLAKFGLGAQKGRFSWNGGLNWMDGAAYDGAFGGQMMVRYSW